MPKPPSASPSSPALDRAAMALRMNRPDEAERLAQDVLKADRGHGGAVLILAQALLVQGKFEAAIAPLQKALKRTDDPRLATMLATALGGAGKSDEAMNLLRGLVARRPAFPPAFLELARQLKAAGHFAEAIDVLKAALVLAPNETELKLQLASLHLGVNDRTAARTMLEQTVQSAPRPDVMTALARVMLLDGDYAASADLFRRALALRPDDALARSDLAACLLEMDERATAETALKSTLQGRPQMLGRAIHALSAASHGRFFLRPSRAKAFFER